MKELLTKYKEHIRGVLQIWGTWSYILHAFTIIFWKKWISFTLFAF